VGYPIAAIEQASSEVDEEHLDDGSRSRSLLVNPLPPLTKPTFYASFFLNAAFTCPIGSCSLLYEKEAY
jgi:hypothetical protein